MFEDSLRSRIRALRKQQGMSQEELAEAAGLGVTTIKKAENPNRGGELTTGTLHSIAQALGVTTTELYADRAPMPGLEEAGDDQVLARLRSAIAPPVGLSGTPMVEDLDQPVDLEMLERDVARARTLYHADDYDAVAQALPTILTQAHLAVAEFATDQAYRTRALALRMAGAYLTQVRQIDLALVALRACIQDAAKAGDQMLASTAVSGQGWALTRQGRLDECERLCVTVADAIEPQSMRKAAPAELAAWGHLLFRAAAAAVRNNSHDRARDLMGVAGAAASALGRETPCWSTFGPLTVAVKNAEFALLEGHPDRTLAEADRMPRIVDVGNISQINWERHRLDIATALAQTGELEHSTHVLTGVRERSPQWIRRQRSAYETLELLFDRSRRPSDSMVALASHMGMRR
ncbi:helix-turn-helix domain-containing protein [Nocardiopsis algeriensis]|uniref:Transcriptional regulator with XRE-family HTH domain n=1 Tax=Nocardiopsis algeriensis TaxID=1478215 RepID=A0A841IJP7_9ACTN|nr:helix-turn-helix transcriptional regulator [Nocardiopsis algeriensis]MBB6118164.1 transcriptional regulator with XRE-family HTH domain [Nocardiopsis algeriensis]